MEKELLPFCLNPFTYQRIPTREVKIGDIPLGGSNPIRIQSMTTTDTMDTLATVEQTIRMWESGAEYVRITAPSKKEAENLAAIKKELRKRGCPVPLIADIHYTPNAAEVAARIVEKVRVNPGNYVDKKRFDIIEYSDEQYQAELDRIHDRFAPLVKICKENGTAMRIGTNHGSLSDRIMSRYGDTPLGMVESAMEFLRICELYGYHDIVLSMKASNTQVMVQAYRLLMQKMLENGMVYPLHLGVTEAGEGEDGRIKSAQGIGALLMDGIGDTVRVSLTEEPEYESPVAKFIVDFYQQGYPKVDVPVGLAISPTWDPFAFNRRASHSVTVLGGDQVPRVISGVGGQSLGYAELAGLGYRYSQVLDKYNISDMAADFVEIGEALPPVEMPGGLKQIMAAPLWGQLREKRNRYPLWVGIESFLTAKEKHPDLNFVRMNAADWMAYIEEGPRVDPTMVCVVESVGREAGHLWRQVIHRMDHAGWSAPVVLETSIPDVFEFYQDDHLPAQYQLPLEAKQQLYIASLTGSQAVDGQLDGLWLSPSGEVANRTSFGILQAGRMRITKTEYISCPSCGRTLFDLQETTARIRKRTEHLKGVKIGIMGCIVNGPGEMADADYGYVGVGPGKIALYRGKTVVEKSVKTEDAVDKLIDLIREDGNWVEES